MESEYCPSLLGEEERNAPNSTYSFANILASNLALTLELRGTEMLVKVLCGRESFKVVGVPPPPPVCLYLRRDRPEEYQLPQQLRRRPQS